MGPAEFDEIARLRKEVRTASRGAVPGLAYRAMEIPDANERRTLLGEIYNRIDESNWQEVLDQFGRSYNQTGRTLDREYLFALSVAGQRLGPDIMEGWKERGLSKHEDESWYTFYGWAGKDPNAAKKWLDELGVNDPAQSKRLLPGLLGGLALHDSDRAIEMLASLPKEDRNACIGHFTWNLIQNEGLDRAVDWMIGVQQSAEGKDDPYAKKVRDEILGRVFGSAQTSSDSAAMLASRLEKINEVLPLEDGQLAGKLAQVKGGAALDLMSRLAAGKVLGERSEESTTFQSTVRLTAKTSPEETIQWLAANTSSPIQADAALVACRFFLSAGDEASLAAALDVVKDPVVRRRIEKELGQ